MKKYISLSVIILLGLALRLYHLDSRPVGFTWDEAALGYNAYSLLKTGKDEYGKILPVVFKSFGDYKPGLYIYLTVPMVKIFGLNEFATRLPSAILGTLTILIVYLLVCELFVTCHLSLVTSLILAINPWSIHFSRGAWEANVSLFITTLAVLLFLKKRYLFSSIFFALTFWTYQGSKMFTPLLVISLLLIYKPKIKKLIWPGLLGLLMLLPVLWNFGSQSGRLKIFNVFGYTRSSEVVNKILNADDQKDIWGFHAEIIDQIRGVGQRYLNHLSPKFLFFTGDWSNLRQSTPYYGYFHLPEIITILVGLVILLRTNNQLTKLLLGWLLLAILPSALSRDIVSGVRSLPMVIPLTILSGIGLAKLMSNKFLSLCHFVTLLLFLIYFTDLYFIHSPLFVAKDWLYAYKPALQALAPIKDKYNKIIFSDVFGQPYIFVLFYYQVNPATYQVSAKLQEDSAGDVGQVTTFDKYEFRRIYWPIDRSEKSTIFVGDQFELPEKDMNLANLIRIKEVFYPNGEHALRIVALQ